MTEFEINDLNNEQKDLVDIIGLEAFNKLVFHYGGSQIYIPKTDTIERQRRNTKICNEYQHGKALKFLANKYNLTETQIRTILNDVYVRKSDHIAVGQMSLSFDEV